MTLEQATQLDLIEHWIHGWQIFLSFQGCCHQLYLLLSLEVICGFLFLILACIGGNFSPADDFIGIALDRNPIYGPNASDFADLIT